MLLLMAKDYFKYLDYRELSEGGGLILITSHIFEGRHHSPSSFGHMGKYESIDYRGRVIDILMWVGCD